MIERFGVCFAPGQDERVISVYLPVGYGESGAYYVLAPEAVAQTVNTYCNPFVQEVTHEDLEIRTN